MLITFQNEATATGSMDEYTEASGQKADLFYANGVQTWLLSKWGELKIILKQFATKNTLLHSHVNLSVLCFVKYAYAHILLSMRV